ILLLEGGVTSDGNLEYLEPSAAPLVFRCLPVGGRLLLGGDDRGGERSLIHGEFGEDAEPAGERWSFRWFGAPARRYQEQGSANGGKRDEHSHAHDQPPLEKTKEPFPHDCRAAPMPVQVTSWGGVWKSYSPRPSSPRGEGEASRVGMCWLFRPGAER